VADGRRPVLAHLRQRRRLARSCTKVVGAAPKTFVLMSSGNEQSVIADDGIDIEPALHDPQAAIAAQMVPQPLDRRLVEHEPHCSVGARGRPELHQQVDDERRDRALLQARPGVNGPGADRPSPKRS
jgi:hypothetical protein